APRIAGDLHEGLPPDRPQGTQRQRTVAQAHHGVDQRIAHPLGHRLRRPLSGAPLRLRDAARGDDAGVRDVVRQGKALYIGVSEWRAEEIRAGRALAQDLGIHLISNQPQYNMLWRVIEEEVIPASQELGLSQIVWSPIAQGVLTGKYKKGQPLPEGSRATDEAGGARAVQRFLDDQFLDGVAQLEPIAAELDLTMAQLAIAWVLSNDNVASALVGASRPEQIASNAAAAGVTLEADVLARIDGAIGHLAERDPAKTVSPATRPS